ncbi:hypothetical protein CU633_00295 [Bacillus sp. V3-13]|uniref:hypothetical protein n=1 Tax=Bacillus sp. V3-13 TaxID=2053728 RepID=UPI000C782EEE|nr:hypothetical protein [Bacillus sp. V3-13]PLR79450.1 hypothetical protein CU633_00295 [Bacillus sp. V3-13]
MKKHLFHFIIILLLLPVPDIAKAGQGGNVLTLEELTVQVMPEYTYHPDDKKKDGPVVLYGYHGTFMNKSDQPQKGRVEIPLPMAEKKFRIGFVADYNHDLTEMNEIEYELDMEKGTISWKTSEAIQPEELYKFVIEYYAAPLEATGDSKKLSYAFKSFADIGILNIVFMEPLNTDSFKLEPEPISHQENTYGMNMFMYQFNGVKMNQEEKLNLEYKRGEERTSMEIMEEMAGDAQALAAEKKNETVPTWIAATVIASITAVFAAALIFFLKRRGKKSSQTDKNEAVTAGKKARLRGMLLDGSITEQEYKQLMKKLGG